MFVLTIVAISSLSLGSAPNDVHSVGQTVRVQIEPVSKAALLRARDDCNARLAKQRPDAKLYQELNVAVRHPYSLARMLGPTRDDVIALMAPASWKGMFATTRGRLGCSYTIKDKKLTFRSLEFDGRRRKRLPNEKD